MGTAVAPLRWHALDWPAFLAELEAYRSRFLNGTVNDQERPYQTCFTAWVGKDARARAERMRHLLDFLNAWECRLERWGAEKNIGAWINDHADELDQLQMLTIDDPGYEEQIAHLAAMYKDLMTLRGPEMHNWSDACASKTLGQLAPNAFVMWDNKIKAYAAGDYEFFLREMNDLAGRLIDMSPCADREAAEAHLQEHLRYKVRKPFTKYLDEYNWHVAVGRSYRERR